METAVVCIKSLDTAVLHKTILPNHGSPCIEHKAIGDERNRCKKSLAILILDPNPGHNPGPNRSPGEYMHGFHPLLSPALTLVTAMTSLMKYCTVSGWCGLPPLPATGDKAESEYELRQTRTTSRLDNFKESAEA